MCVKIKVNFVINSPLQAWVDPKSALHTSEGHLFLILQKMVQTVESTHAEKVAMYMELPKEKLINMLIECNRLLDAATGPPKPYLAPIHLPGFLYNQSECKHNKGYITNSGPGSTCRLCGKPWC